MSDNQNESKLRLRNTETNRFKVDTGRLKVQKPQDATDGVQDSLKTQRAELHDALSLRDTSTGRLRRVETAEAQAVGMGERRSETVRLKVIRHQPRIPGVSADSEAPTAPASPVAAPSPIPPTPKPPEPPAAATIPASGPLSEAAEQKKSMTVRLKVKKPGETAEPAAPAPVASAPVPPAPAPAPEPVASVPEPAAPASATVQLPPAEEKKSMTVRLKVQKPAEAPADKTTEVAPPTATSTVPVSEPLKTSTIKLNPLKPQAAPAEDTATKTSTIKLNPIKPAAPTQESAPLSSANGKPEAVKLRPAPGAPVQPQEATAPTGNASETIKIQPNAPAGNASETIKLQPNGAGSTGRKFTLKKDPEPAPSAAPAVPPPSAADGSNAAATVVVPAPEQTGKPSLKLPGSKLKKLPADGAPQAQDTASAPTVPRQAFDSEQDEGIGALPSICAIIGAVAALAIIFNLVMAMLKIM